jgi:primary-amine oxidase
VLLLTEISFLPNQALAVIIDCLNKTSYECALSITNKEELYWKELKGQQPPLHVDEFSELEEVVVKNEDFIKAMAKRGLTDPSMWMVYVPALSVGSGLFLTGVPQRALERRIHGIR